MNIPDMPEMVLINECPEFKLYSVGNDRHVEESEGVALKRSLAKKGIRDNESTIDVHSRLDLCDALSILAYLGDMDKRDPIKKEDIDNSGAIFLPLIKTLGRVMAPYSSIYDCNLKARDALLLNVFKSPDQKIRIPIMWSSDHLGSYSKSELDQIAENCGSIVESSLKAMNRKLNHLDADMNNNSNEERNKLRIVHLIDSAIAAYVEAEQRPTKSLVMISVMAREPWSTTLIKEEDPQLSDEVYELSKMYRADPSSVKFTQLCKSPHLGFFEIKGKNAAQDWRDIFNQAGLGELPE